MKTTVLYLALTFGCIIPTFSQLNRNRKAVAPKEQFQFYPNKEGSYWSDDRRTNKFGGSVDVMGSLDDQAWDRSIFSTTGKTIVGAEEAYLSDRMPCFKPEGIFSMKVYEPDSSSTYTMLLKKY